MMQQVAGIWSVKVKEAAAFEQIVEFYEDETQEREIGPIDWIFSKKSRAARQKRKAREAARLEDHQRREREVREDTLELVDGRLQLGMLAGEGFSLGTYTVSQDEYAIVVYSEQTHPNGEIARWSLRYTWHRFLSGGVQIASPDEKERGWHVEGIRKSTPE